jgi:hypothetical protein
MLTKESNNEMLPEDDPELMYQHTEEYAEMRRLDERTLGLLGEKNNGTQT